MLWFLGWPGELLGGCGWGLRAGLGWGLRRAAGCVAGRMGAAGVVAAGCGLRGLGGRMGRAGDAWKISYIELYRIA